MTRPGLAKARELPLVLAHPTTLLRTADACWRRLFDIADTISEGSVREEGGGRFWYGSTSLILPVQSSEAPFLSAVAERDMHVRVRAVRAAHREACLRAPARLGRFVCEIRVESDSKGVRIDVDVQAPLIERSARAAR